MTTAEPKFPDVTVQLSGEDGNVYAVIGRVAKAIRRAHGDAAADAYWNEARNAGSYDEVLQLTMRTVEVE
jgi:hypothetical protein